MIVTNGSCKARAIPVAADLAMSAVRQAGGGHRLAGFGQVNSWVTSSNRACGRCRLQPLCPAQRELGRVFLPSGGECHQCLVTGSAVCAVPRSGEDEVPRLDALAVNALAPLLDTLGRAHVDAKRTCRNERRVTLRSPPACHTIRLRRCLKHEATRPSKSDN